MRKHKWFLVLGSFLTLALSWAAAPAQADEAPSRLFIDGGKLQGDVLQIFFHTTSSDPPTVENTVVTIDGHEAPVRSIAASEYASAGVSYFLLADSSTSVIERATRDIRALSTAIARNLSPIDNLYIGQPGEDYAPDGFTNDVERLNERIRMLSSGASGKDLYQSIANALDLLADSPCTNPYKCLIVIADNMDNTAGGLSLIELREKVRERRIPVCTIALTYQTSNPVRIDAARDLSSIARLSPGGTAALLGTNHVNIQDAADAILSLRDANYVAVLHVDEVRALTSAATADFCVSITTQDQTMRAAQTLDIGALPIPETAAAGTPAPGPKATPGESHAAAAAREETRSAPDRAPSPFPYRLVIALAAAALVVAAGVLLCIRRQGCSRRPSAEAEREQPMIPYAAQTPSISKEDADFAGPRLMIIRLGGKETIRFQLDMTRPLLIGSDPQRVQLVLDEDTQVYATQCRLDWQDAQLWISALSPPGSTLLNNVPVSRDMPLKSGDVVHIGSVDYRVFWEAPAK